MSPSKSGKRKFDVGHAEIGDGLPTVRSLTDMPIIRPSVNSEFISGRPHSVSCGAKCGVDVQRLRIQRHVGEQHVIHLRDGRRVAVLDHLAGDKILEITPLRSCRRRCVAPS